jgi:hypothetical protein
MNDSNLLRLYDYWRVLSEDEGRAIESADWIRVADCQRQKRCLQEEIEAATPSQTGSPVVYAALGEKLILLEMNNARAIAVRRETVEQEERDLEHMTRNLRQVQRAYAGDRKPAWESYS